MSCQFCWKKISRDTQIHLYHLKSHHAFEMSYKCIILNCYREFHTFFGLQKHVTRCLSQVHKAHSVLNNTISNNQSERIKENNCEELTENICITENNFSDKENSLKSDDIRNYILKFIARLYHKPNVSRSTIQEIIDELQDTIQDISEYFYTKLMKELPSEFHVILKNCLSISVLEDIITEYRRFQYLKKSKFLIPPESFFIGNMYDNKTDGQKTILTIKTCEGQIVPMREILKSQLEIPGFYEKVINIINTDNSLMYTTQVYISFCDGIIWKSIRKYYGDRIVIPLFLYYDDFETGNPLGTAAGIHKVGVLYGSIATLPPQCASLLENIFLVQFLYSSDRTHFGNEKCFHKVIEEIKFLSNTGIVISDTNGCQTRVYFVVVALLGDNLGINSLFGFNESFISEYFCRICRAPKSITRCAMFEDKSFLLTPMNYTRDIAEFSHGIKKKCIFNEIPHFDCTTNYTCDIMHDLFEDVCRYDLARIIQYFINKKYITLEHLNHRIKYFNHQSDFDRGNKIPSITNNHINNGYLIMSAAEMSALVSYLSFIIGDRVPDDDEVWEFYLTLCDILIICTQRIISNDEVNYLRNLISWHHEMYIRLFKETLKPKFHLMIHYPEIIRRMGPLKNLSSMRYEGFHKLSKTYASIITSRRNIIFSLGMKLQLHYFYKLLIKKGLNDTLEVGKHIRTVSLEFLNNIPQMNSDYLTEVSWARWNNIMFKPDFVIVIDQDDNNLYFGIMTRILLDKYKNIFVHYKKCVTLGLDIHFKAYEILLPKENDSEALYSINISEESCVYNIRTCNYHISGDGDYFISLFNV